MAGTVGAGLSEPEVSRERRAIVVTWPSALADATHPHRGVSFRFHHLREDGAGVHAEVDVNLCGVSPNGRPPLVARDRLNLASMAGRTRLAEKLPATQGRIAWRPVVEVACDRTIEEFRRGEPSTDMSQVVIPEGPPPYLIPKLLPEGQTSMVYADGASGKSLLALAIATSLQSGVAVTRDIRPVKRVNCLYCDWETTLETTTRRLDKIARGLGISRPPVRYLRMSRPLVYEAERVEREVTEGNIGLIVLDSAGFATEGELKESQGARELFNALRTLETTALIVHHITKADAKASNGGGEAFGTVYFRNGARSAWELRSRIRSAGTLALSLFHRKSNEEQLEPNPIGLTATFQADRVTFTGYDVAADPELVRHGPLFWQVKTLLEGGSMSVKELVEATGKDRSTIYSLLKAHPTVFVEVSGGGRGRGNEGRWGLLAAGD